MRNREQVVWDFVRQWLGKAEQDLRTAQVLLGTEAKDYFPSAFHCQQAAEKYLKAYLVRYQVEFRKTHDLEELLTLAAPIDSSLVEEIGPCGWLTPFGVEFRYPGDYPVVDHETAKRAFKEAEAVKESVMNRLGDYLAKGRPDQGNE